MALKLDVETRLALVDEIASRIRPGEQKRIANALTEVLGTKIATEEPRLSRFLNKDPKTVERLLGPDRADKVLEAVGRELGAKPDELLRHAEDRARSGNRRALGLHPAWEDLGDIAPWVDRVPGLPEGMATLRARIELLPPRAALWLVGPAGSGKSARLWRAHKEGLGQLLDRVPSEAVAGAVWLVDETGDPNEWIQAAARYRARLVIAARTAVPHAGEAARLELGPWGLPEAGEFLDRLDEACEQHREVLGNVDLERVADMIAAQGGPWTPLDLGNVIRMFVDDRARLELDANNRDLRIRSALHQLSRRSVLSPSQARLWYSHGEDALRRASAAVFERDELDRPVSPVEEAALRAALSELTGPKVGARTARTSARTSSVRKRRASR